MCKLQSWRCQGAPPKLLVLAPRSAALFNVRSHRAIDGVNSGCESVKARQVRNRGNCPQRIFSASTRLTQTLQQQAVPKPILLGGDVHKTGWAKSRWTTPTRSVRAWAWSFVAPASPRARAAMPNPRSTWLLGPCGPRPFEAPSSFSGKNLNIVGCVEVARVMWIVYNPLQDLVRVNCHPMPRASTGRCKQIGENCCIKHNRMPRHLIYQRKQ